MWRVVILLLALMLLATMTQAEGYDAQTASITQQALKDVAGKVKTTQHSIVRIAIVSEGPKSKDGGFLSIFTGKKATMRVRPKYFLSNNVIVIGTTFSVEGRGRKDAAAKKNAEKKAAAAIKNIEKTLRDAGKMQ